MSVLGDFKGTSIFCKVAFILLLMASMFACISYTTTSWGYNDIGSKLHYGLWRVCGEADIPTGCQVLDGWANDWYGVVQAFVSFGFIGTLVTFLLIILYMLVGKCQNNGECGLAAAIIAIVTGVLHLIGCIIFAAKFDNWKDSNVEDYKLGYSFALSIVALLLEIVGGILMIVDAKGFGGGGGGQTKPSA